MNSTTVNQVDLTISDPYTYKAIDYIKPRIRYAMEHNSTGYRKEKEFDFQIPILHLNNTKLVRR